MHYGGAYDDLDFLERPNPPVEKEIASLKSLCLEKCVSAIEKGETTFKDFNEKVSTILTSELQGKIQFKVVVPAILSKIHEIDSSDSSNEKK